MEDLVERINENKQNITMISNENNTDLLEVKN